MHHLAPSFSFFFFRLETGRLVQDCTLDGRNHRSGWILTKMELIQCLYDDGSLDDDDDEYDDDDLL